MAKTTAHINGQQDMTRSHNLADAIYDKFIERANLCRDSLGRIENLETREAVGVAQFRWTEDAAVVRDTCMKLGYDPKNKTTCDQTRVPALGVVDKSNKPRGGL